MTDALLSPGEIIHVMTRRLFEDDLRRHFAGRVLFASEQQVRAEGYVYVLNAAIGEYRKRKDLRVRIISLSDAGNIIYVLPPETDLHALEYKTIDDRLVFTDGTHVSLDINEFGINS